MKGSLQRRTARRHFVQDGRTPDEDRNDDRGQADGRLQRVRQSPGKSQRTVHMELVEDGKRRFLDEAQDTVSEA